VIDEIFQLISLWRSFALNYAEAIENFQQPVDLQIPGETTSHIKRVSAYAVELYECWASRHSVLTAEIGETKDSLRAAAMLHDIGNVALNNAIFEKTSALSGDERLQVRLHTIHGARLFSPPETRQDTMAVEVALCHHEDWDGNGYPGKIEDLFAERICLGSDRKGTDIPLSARIVAVADVFDVLTSGHIYKPAWKQAIP
jgi:HD-GYP domain-containing protein (c-di-GMP phosphodiesterase class II)